MEDLRRDRPAALRLAVAAALGLLFGPALAEAAGTFDFCSAVAVRPDQNLRDAKTCTKSYSDEEIAASAQSAWVGDFTDVAHPSMPAPPRACMPNPSHAANAPYVQHLKDLKRALGGPPLWIVHMSRFDLVPAVLASQSSFRSSYLLRTTRPWSYVTGFFANDHSLACVASPCSWSDSWKAQEGHDNGTRLRDFIDRSGGTGSYQNAVYYLARPDGGSVYYPTSALANLNDPAYRAWRVAEAKEALRVGGYDTVDLNHKIHQYLYVQEWLGSATYPDVAAIKARNDTAWSAPPVPFSYGEYMQGLVALSRDLRAGGVPYSFVIALRAWNSDSFDDKSTTTVNEADLLREIMTGAHVVFLDRPIAETPAGVLESAVSDLNKRGVAVVPIDSSCGLSSAPVLAPPEAPSLAR